MSTSSRPAFSVVIPTRDRPDLVRWSVEAMCAQTFTDFEVIVSDNPATRPCRDEIERLDDARVRVVSPEGGVAMAENWEFGASFARGEYVSVISDKTVLMPSALESAARVIERGAPDIVNWWTESFDPLDEAVSSPAGYYQPHYGAPLPGRYDPREVLATRLRFAERRGEAEGARHFLGKICFGVMSRGVVEQIVATTGRLFHPIAPDYTSMVPALCVAESIVDLGRPMQLMLQVMVTNGRRQARDPRHARQFLLDTDPSGALIDALPLPRLYGSVHNVVAHDYVASLERCPHEEGMEVDVANVTRRAREDLALMAWADRSERAAQYALLERYEQEHGVTPERLPVVHERLRRVTLDRRSRSTRLGRAARRVLGRSIGTRFASVVDAARAADDHYRSAEVATHL